MPRTPTEVVELLIERVPARSWDELPQLYAADAVVQLPMQLPEGTTIRGRDALIQHFRRAAELPLEMVAENVVIHETVDPEVVIAEFGYRARNTATNAHFTVANIFVVRVRDGVIVESRDYSDHVQFAAAFGRLRAVADRLQAPPSAAA
jgi:ketosteroid isomerase-like protein